MRPARITLSLALLLAWDLATCLTAPSAALGPRWSTWRPDGARGWTSAVGLTTAAFAHDRLEWRASRLHVGLHVDWTHLNALSRHGALVGWPWPVIGGDAGPPPPLTPALFHKFQMLLAGYHAVGGDARFTFAEWLVLNAVTEPREFFCMMWLWRSHCAAKHAA